MSCCPWLMAFKKTSLLLLGLCSFAMVMAAQEEMSADALLERGVNFVRAGDKERALHDYNRAIALNPGFANAYFSRGVLYDDQGNLGQALEDYGATIRLDSSNVAAYFNRGLIFFNQQKYESALADYNSALRVNPAYTDAYYNRAILHRKQGDMDLALGDYELTLRLNPQYWPAYFNRGSILLAQGKLDPDKPVVHYWPEFGQQGKDKVLVRHFFNHSAGVPGWEPRIPFATVFDWKIRSNHWKSSPSGGNQAAAMPITRRPSAS